MLILSQVILKCDATISNICPNSFLLHGGWGGGTFKSGMNKRVTYNPWKFESGTSAVINGGERLSC